MTGEKFETKKSLGQHFLNSDFIPRALCDAGDVTPGDTVLEIGPGTGVLTQEFLRRGATVVALEADTRAIAVLEERFAAEIASKRLLLLHQDVRTLDITSIPHLRAKPFKVVANIPYYLSGMLFRTILEAPIQPTTLVYLVQKEVAKRITSSLERGEKESILSLSVKVYGVPSYVKTVTKGHFNPPPKVDSAIVLVRNINRDNFKNVDEALFFKLLHLGFGQKRKQLLRNLLGILNRETLTRIFSSLSISVSTRAEDLPVETWLLLTKAIGQEIAHS